MTQPTAVEEKFDPEAIEKSIITLLERQDDVEYRKRIENRRRTNLKNEFDLLSKLLTEATSRVESLDIEIESHRKRILERQKYKSAMETLCEEEGEKARRLEETVAEMKDHLIEQRELIATFYQYLLNKKGVHKKDLDAIMLN
jgi:chromosome segregation ATPase